jgi:hypothetical protein
MKRLAHCDSAPVNRSHKSVGHIIRVHVMQGFHPQVGKLYLAAL